MTASTNHRLYIETFEGTAGGWWGFAGNFKGYKRLEHRHNTLISRSPWWIDYNHAPPGAGYLHMVACLHTAGFQTEALRELAGINRFITGGHSIDFTGVELSVRLRGELLTRGADLLFLIQANIDQRISGWLLTGRPFRVGKDWTEQTIVLEPDERLWTCLGAREDRSDMYGVRPLESVLNHVNTNIMFVLFPLTIAPMGPIDGDPHRLRAGLDYPVWQSELPEGYIEFDEVRLSYPHARRTTQRFTPTPS